MLITHRFSTRYVAAVAPGHPLAKQRSITLKALLSEPLVLRDSRFETRRWLNLAALHLQLPLKAVINLDHIESIKRLVRAGDIATVLPGNAVMADAAAGEWAMIDLHGDTTSGATVLCSRNGRVQTRAAQAAMDLIAKSGSV